MRVCLAVCVSVCPLSAFWVVLNAALTSIVFFGFNLPHQSPSVLMPPPTAQRSAFFHRLLWFNLPHQSPSILKPPPAPLERPELRWHACRLSRGWREPSQAYVSQPVFEDGWRGDEPSPCLYRVHVCAHACVGGQGGAGCQGLGCRVRHPHRPRCMLCGAGAGACETNLPPCSKQGRECAWGGAAHCLAPLPARK